MHRCNQALLAGVQKSGQVCIERFDVLDLSAYVAVRMHANITKQMIVTSSPSLISMFKAPWVHLPETEFSGPCPASCCLPIK